MTVPGSVSRKPGIIKFLVTYVALMGLFLLLIGYEPIKRVLDIDGLYSRGIVAVTAFFLESAGMAVRTSGTILNIPGVALDIRFGCNGLEAVLIYSVALLAFPAPWIKRVTGILAGFVIMQALNIVRIIALALVRVHYPGFFELFHIYIAQGVLIAVALVLFIAWIGYAQKGV